jgi:hypothetical protein
MIEIKATKGFAQGLIMDVGCLMDSQGGLPTGGSAGRALTAAAP